MAEKSTKQQQRGITPLADLDTEHLARRLQCQALVARLTTEFIGLSQAELEQGIHRALGEFAEFVGADRVTVGLYDQVEAETWRIAYEWYAEGLEPKAERLRQIPMGFWKRQHTVLEGRVIGYSSIEQVRKTSNEHADLVESLEMRAGFSLPISEEDGPILGFLMFSRQEEGRFWDRESATIMRVVSSFLIHALDRQADDTALATSQKRMQALASSGAVGVFIADENDRLIFVNETLRKLAGLSQEATQQRWQDLLMPSLPLTHAALGHLLERHHAAAPFEAALINQDGSLIAGMTSMTRVEGSADQRTIGLFVDRSKRRQVEASLAFRYGLDRLITRLAARFIHGAPDKVGKNINRALCEIGELLDVDRCHLFLVNPDDRSAMPAAHWERSGAESDLSGFEHVNPEVLPAFTELLKESDAVIRLDPEVLAAAQMDPEANFMAGAGVKSGLIVPIHCENEILGLLVVCNVREARRWDDETVNLLPVLGEILGSAYTRHRAHRELAALNRRLEDRVAERTVELLKTSAELEGFSYTVSHDLRSPLRSIDGFSEILLQESAAVLDQDGKDLLVSVRGASQRMGELIDALLELARATRTQRAWSRLDISALARGVAAKLRRKGDLVVEVADNLEAVGDHRLVELLLRKLIANAARTGQLNKAPSGSRVHIGSVDRNGENAFFIRTQGLGLDPDFTNAMLPGHTPRVGDDADIGLLTIRRIVSMHGGRIWAEPGPQQETSVLFTMPGSGAPRLPTRPRKSSRETSA